MPESWPSQPIDLGRIPENNPEVKTESRVCLTGVTEQENLLSKIFQWYSSWHQLKKITAWILRYKANLLQLVSGRRKGASLPLSSVPIKPLSINEVNDAKAAIVTCVQEQCFQEDLKFLNLASKVEGRTAVIPRSRNIYKLDPMLIYGVIRVGGRLRKAPINSDAKHPIILPRKHHVVNLIIRHWIHPLLDEREVLAHQCPSSCQISYKSLLFLLQERTSITLPAKDGKPSPWSCDGVTTTVYLRWGRLPRAISGKARQEQCQEIWCSFHLSNSLCYPSLTISTDAS